MDKTVKMRSYDGKDAPQEKRVENPVEQQKPASGLAIKNPQLEEERAKSQEYLKRIKQLEASLRDEKAKREEKPKPTSGLAIKNPALEEERARSQEYLKKIEQLENSLKEENAKSATLADVLKKISSMALTAAQTKDTTPQTKDEAARLKDTQSLSKNKQ